MAPANTAVKTVVTETLEEQLARLLSENAELQAKVSSIPAAGAFVLGVTVERAEGTNGPKDKGSKGGSLRISLGKSNIYPTKAMVMAIFEHEKEVKAALLNPAITR